MISMLCAGAAKKIYSRNGRKTVLLSYAAVAAAAVIRTHTQWELGELCSTDRPTLLTLTSHIVVVVIIIINIAFIPHLLHRLTVVSSSCKTWSYSDMATQKMMAVTSSKQWIHFFRSDLWPPTSNSLLVQDRMFNNY